MAPFKELNFTYFRVMERQARPQAKRKILKTPERLSRSPKRNGREFDSSGGTTSTSKLTKAALAHHNRRHGPAVPRMGPDGRQGPASESELDTLVEMQLRNTSPSRNAQVFTKQTHRRTSSSSPVRFRGEPFSAFRNYRASTSPNNRSSGKRDSGGLVRAFKTRERTIGQDSDADESELSPGRKQQFRPNLSPGRRVNRIEEYSPPRRRAPNIRYDSRIVDGTEISVEQSRYSVTDYFKKYHPKETLTSNQTHEKFNNRAPISRLANKDIAIRLATQMRTSSEIDDRTTRSIDVTGTARDGPRLALFRNDNDLTISAIPDDDNFSSVSGASVSTANTVDERKFRRGIATLDANIARLQSALQKTKSMLT